MIQLKPTDTLQVFLAGAVAATQPTLYAAFADIAADGTTFAPSPSSGATNSTTAVNWVASPATGDIRQIKYLSLFNGDSASVTVTVRIVDNGTNRILDTFTLAANESLKYIEALGFVTTSSSGGGGGVSDGDKGDITVSGSGATWTIDSDVVATIRSIPQNSKSAAYTTVLTDAGKHIFHPSADTTARVFTIDSNANVAYPIGTALTFVNQASAGVVTISITSDTMRLAGAGTTGSRTLAANGIATALKVTSTEWIISGTGLT